MVQLQLARTLLALIAAGWLVVSGIVINPNENSNFIVYKEKYKDHYNYEIIIKENNKTYKHTLYENIDGDLSWFDWDVEIINKKGKVTKEFITETGFGSNISWDEFEESLTPDEKKSIDKFWDFESKDYNIVKKELDKLARNKTAEQKAKERWFNK